MAGSKVPPKPVGRPAVAKRVEEKTIASVPPAAPMASVPAPKPPMVAASPVAAPSIAAPKSTPSPKSAGIAPIARAIAAAPVQLVEATRAVAEEAMAAVGKAADAVKTATINHPVSHDPMKGPVPMATTFASTTATPAPEKMQAMFGDIQSRAKQSMEKSAKLVEEMSEFAKGNVEAMIASGRVAAKGVETLGQDAAEYSKKSFEGAAAAFKGMVAAKSPTELLKLQSDYARTAFDAAVAEGSKFSEAWLKLVGEIAQPLSSRAALAVEKVKAPIA